LSDLTWASVRPNHAVCTSPWQENDESVAEARAMAAWFGCRYVSRRRRSIHRLLADERAQAVLVAEKRPVWYHRAEPNRPLFFHPGMALLRMQKLERGESDRLLRVAGIRAGDVILDATLGLGADALVMAHAVGERGRVVACESSWVLARTFAWTVAHASSQPSLVAAALARIEVVAKPHLDVLQSLPDDAVDVVYFDPMFRTPTGRPNALDPLRPWANPDPLTMMAWQEAQRVARRAVVLKERPQSGEFERFGLVPDKPKGRFAYGVWRKRDEDG
jgi:16S rRNA (guanine1516-N2)-methyltransferase